MLKNTAKDFSSSKQWYWVAALYKSVIEGSNKRKHLWERLVFVMLVDENTDAHLMANRLAKDKEHEYTTAKGQKLKWVFQEIEKIEALFDQEMTNGSEVYWQFFEKLDA